MFNGAQTRSRNIPKKCQPRSFISCCCIVAYVCIIDYILAVVIDRAARSSFFSRSGTHDKQRDINMCNQGALSEIIPSRNQLRLKESSRRVRDNGTVIKNTRDFRNKKKTPK